MFKFGELKCKHVLPGMLILLDNDDVLFAYVVSVIHELVEGIYPCLRVTSIHYLKNEKIHFSNELFNENSLFVLGHYVTLNV